MVQFVGEMTYVRDHFKWPPARIYVIPTLGRVRGVTTLEISQMFSRQPLSQLAEEFIESSQSQS